MSKAGGGSQRRRDAGVRRHDGKYGITVIAAGVQSEIELAELRELGFEGATGPGVKG